MQSTPRRPKIQPNNRDKTGLSLERVVARIQQMMDPNSSVSHNEKLLDRVGNTRQYDVVIRGQFGGRPILGVIECKDHNRKSGPDTVEAFAKKTENLGANLRIIVSNKGFTKQALHLAQHESIGCLSLLPSNPEQVGFSIGDMWYGVIRKWTNIRLVLHFDLPSPPVSKFDPKEVKWQGKPVALWFLKQLFTTYGEETKPGELTLRRQFNTTRYLDVDGKEWPVRGILCTALRIYQKKRKWVSWSGDAFFDWHTSKISIPDKGTLVGSAVEIDLHTWPDYEGNIPTPDDPLQPGLVRVVFYDGQKWDPTQDSEVPDLETL